MAEENKEIKKRKVGREPLPDDLKQNQRLNLRLSKAELKSLNDKLLVAANFSSLSELVKNILFKRKIVLYTRDKNLDTALEEVKHLRSEMNAVGKNFNQIAKRINSYKEGKFYKKEFLLIEKSFNEFEVLQRELIERFDLLVEKWLQK